MGEATTAIDLRRYALCAMRFARRVVSRAAARGQ
jgi:hypothetical protein